jgi:putative aminopeptidase FrvX
LGGHRRAQKSTKEAPSVIDYGEPVSMRKKRKVTNVGLLSFHGLDQRICIYI